MDCSPPGSPVHGILRARILECFAVSWTQVPCIGRRILNHWAAREALDSALSWRTTCCLPYGAQQVLTGIREERKNTRKISWLCRYWGSRTRCDIPAVLNIHKNKPSLRMLSQGENSWEFHNTESLSTRPLLANGQDWLLRGEQKSIIIAAAR